MPRTKPKDEIQSRAEADAKMQRLNEIEERLTEWTLSQQKQMLALKNAHAMSQAEAGRPLLEIERKLILKELATWAKKDQIHWKAKTLCFATGRLGIRKGMPKVDLYKKAAKTWDTALNLLSKLLPKYEKLIPAIDKEKLIADREEIDPKMLLKCGLKIVQKDEFWIETEAVKAFDLAAKELKNEKN